MKIAVIGAGFLGTCVSLELARRGYVIDLFDDNSEPVSQAGHANEGKIHMGLVYANDSSRRTARTMLKGAFYFAPLLERWIDAPLDETWFSRPFYYGAHRDSLLSIEKIRTHFSEVQGLYRELKDQTGLSYLNIDSENIFQELTGNHSDLGFDAQYVPYLFQTEEKSVNTTKVALCLRQQVRRSNSIEFHADMTIQSVEQLHGGQLKLLIGGNYTESAAYDHVVNAAWFGRLAIDQTLDLLPQRPWLHRYKCGIFVNTNKKISIVPTMTLLLGSFGDLVDFQDGSYYASWYPAGMIATSNEVRPGGWPLTLNPDEQSKIRKQMLHAMAPICPGVKQLLGPDYKWELRGNAIFAWGEQDIDKLGSELHRRYDIGAFCVGNYHTVDPGKYTMVPYFANQVADRIEGRPKEEF